MNRPSTEPLPLSTAADLGGGQVLQFEWLRRGDRYQQQLWLRSGGRRLPLLTSVEADCQSGRLARPTCQQAIAQENHGGVALMGIGQSLGIHWSMVVRAVATSRVASRVPTRIRLEFAARRERPGPELAGCYVVGSDLVVTRNSLPELTAAGASSRLELSLRGHPNLALDSRQSQIDWNPLSRMVTIRMECPPAGFPQTVQWAVEVGLV